MAERGGVCLYLKEPFYYDFKLDVFSFEIDAEFCGLVMGKYIIICS